MLRIGKRRVAYRVLAGKPEGKKPLGSPRLRWEDNIKMNLQEVRGEAWTGLICFRVRRGKGACKCGNDS
jgi:hypothetical protein